MECQYGKEEIDFLLQSKDSNVVMDALMYLCFNINDPVWAQDKCLDAIRNGTNEDVKGLGLTCLGHIARIYSRVDKEKVMPVLQCLQDSPLSGRAQDALDDIDTFAR